MGDYINIETVISITDCGRNCHYNTEFCDGVREKAIAEAPVIEIPKNATYGDVIMKVLESAGNYEQNESNGLMYIHEVGTPPDYCVVAVNKKLWNTPFKKGGEE